MFFFIYLCLIPTAFKLTLALGGNMVCYYNTGTTVAKGLPEFKTTNLEAALNFCTHLIYGYASINQDAFTMKTRNHLQRYTLYSMAELRNKYPNVKFLLSVGGDEDYLISDKYLQILEGDTKIHKIFADSARSILKGYKFDGLDLAFPMPRIKPVKAISRWRKYWNFIKNVFTKSSAIATNHTEQFTNLINSLKYEFANDDLMLTLTVLPNVDTKKYLNPADINSSLDFVNLATFDFTTPELNPTEADYTAPLYPTPSLGNRNPQHNIDFQVNHWISQDFPQNKINVGVASYGRAWKMTKYSNYEGLPIVSSTKGPAEPGQQTKTDGLLNWAEICFQLFNTTTPLQRVPDPNKKFGTYAFRPADQNGDYGLWVSYDDPDTVSQKAAYAKTHGLGGVALFDLSFDDFQGQCNGEIFPMLRAIKYKLL